MYDAIISERKLSEVTSYHNTGKDELLLFICASSVSDWLNTYIFVIMRPTFAHAK